MFTTQVILAIGALLPLASSLAVVKLESSVSVGSFSGRCINQVTFDDNNSAATVSQCVGLSDGYGDQRVMLHCDPNNPGMCGDVGGNECACGMWVNRDGLHAWVHYDGVDQVCNLPGSTVGDIGNCVQREGTGYPVEMIA